MAPSTSFSVSTVVLAALLASASALTVNTPTGLVTCQPSALTWSDGTAPYYLSILPGGNSMAAALESFSATSATSYTWNVNIAAGTSITVAIKDSTGVTNYSDKVTIQQGTDTSCVGKDSSNSGTAASAGTSASAAAASPASAASQGASAGSSAASAPSSSSTAKTGAAGRTAVVGSAGALALAAAAMLV